LKNINIPKNIKTIGSGAFEQTGIINIELPESLIDFGRKIPSTNYAGGVFSGCENLETVTIKANITNIPYNTFINCKSLKNVTLNDGLETIGISAIENCKALTNIILPKTLTNIGDGAFASSGLTSIEIPEKVTTFGIVGTRSINPVMTLGVFVNCTNLSKVIFNGKIEVLPSKVFRSCSSLKEIVLPDSIKIIERYVFSGCRNLESIILPSTITTIGDRAFEECVNLTTITIPESVKEIEFGDSVFSKTDKLNLATQAALRRVGYGVVRPS
jgi:hypothetical protein